ncbi:type VII secretion system-associated protein [Streptomyces tsukubensis]|uniref:Type VII secretion system-associated protein n=1 Tax=Streptomyces tsukubensis TaxID=83656 RepID=A0A1V4ACF4_9ACTN|nr:type VII secretion system-associated protein [Streptomyces tsukubensis]OON81113.1 hypothetical protein B1H18_09955 [Streptomyces tsukubensis]QFR94949.1 type VII secretion system-associated protein [Streptomyces tsukubensis]
MSDGGKTIVLNKEWMKSFINGDLHDFQSAIAKMLVSAPSERFGSNMDGVDVVSITKLQDAPDNIHSNNQHPLAIGALAGKDGLGADLVKSILDAAGKLGDFIEDQKKLFDDIESNLRDTMETFLKTEGDSMDKIDGEKFLDVFEDVEEDIADSLSGGGGGGGGGDE